MRTDDSKDMKLIADLLAGRASPADGMPVWGAVECPTCGRRFPRNTRGRPKEFCSQECRLRYHRKHADPTNWKSARTAVCPVCGKEFTASREYNRKRKYCSHACANKARAMKKKHAEADGREGG